MLPFSTVRPERLASQVDETYPHVDALRDRRDELKATLQAARSDLYRIYRLDGILYVLTATPLFGMNREVIGYAETIFAVSKEALQVGYRNIRRTVFSVMASFF